MTKIKIKDLPKNVRVSNEDMKKVVGGTIFRINKTDAPTIVNPSVKSGDFPYTEGGGDENEE
jgi:hypothetical protein